MLKDILDDIKTHSAPIAAKRGYTPKVVLTPKSSKVICEHGFEINGWHSLALCHMPEKFYHKASATIGNDPDACHFVIFEGEINKRAAELRKAAGLE